MHKAQLADRFGEPAKIAGRRRHALPHCTHHEVLPVGDGDVQL